MNGRLTVKIVRNKIFILGEIQLAGVGSSLHVDSSFRIRTVEGTSSCFTHPAKNHETVFAMLRRLAPINLSQAISLPKSEMSINWF